MRKLIVLLGMASGACALDGASFDRHSTGPSPSTSDADGNFDPYTGVGDGGQTNPIGNGDSGPTDPDAGDSGGGTFCERQRTPHFLCSDFDTGGLPGPWTAQNQTGSGSLGITNDGDRGSNVVGMRIGSTTNSGACLKASLGSGRTSVRIEADVRLLGGDTSRFDLFLVHGNNADEVNVEVSASGEVYWDLEAGGSETNVSTGRSFSGWQRVGLEVTTNGSSVAARYLVGGSVVSERTTAAKVFEGTTSIELGDCISLEGKNWQLRFDNVVVDAH